MTTQENRMPPKECLCTVINKCGQVEDMRYYARDFAELYHFMLTVKRVRKIITYVVIC